MPFLGQQWISLRGVVANKVGGAPARPTLRSFAQLCVAVTRVVRSKHTMVISLSRVLISDEVDPKCVDILQSHGVEVVTNTKLSKNELIAEIPVS